MLPYLKVGDLVLLSDGQVDKILKLCPADNRALLESGMVQQLNHLKLLTLTPEHLAIYLFNINGREAVLAWRWDGSINQLLNDMHGFLIRHTSIETILTIVNAEHYSWQDGGREELEETAREVLVHLERLLDENEPPPWKTINKPLERK